MPTLLTWIPACAPLLLLAAALASGHATDGRRAARLATLACAGALVLLAGCTLVVAVSGPMRAVTPAGGYGPGVGLDALSACMGLLVAFIGTVVLAFSRNALDGDPGQGRFVAWLCTTLGCVLAVILAAGLVQLLLAWIGTSLALHQLLLFHGERPGARRAAHKKFLVSRLSDACLAGAAAALVWQFGTPDLAAIGVAAKAMASGPTPPAVHLAAVLVVGAALTKSAQLPFHGWLPEAMETPTPVSALLHAGLINGGGFLVLRLADVMVLSQPTLHALALAGGLTALVGSSVMLTQTSIKGTLAWSTIAQMGFMLLQCGLGAFAAAMLHIVAHSLYKAHAFLGSGDAAATGRALVAAAPPGAPRPMVLIPAVLGAALLAMAAAVLAGGGLANQPGPTALAAVLAMGLAQYVATTSREADGAVILRSLGLAASLAAVYLLLQAGARWILAGSLPTAAAPAGPLDLGLALLVVVSFGLLAVRPALMPRLARRPGWQALQIHLANGFYVNALADRLLGRDPATPKEA